MKIKDLVPDAEMLLAMEPEDVGFVLLKYLTSQQSYGRPQSIKRGNFFMQSASPARDYPPQYFNRIDEALMSGWVWLEREGFLLPAPNQQDRDWEVVSTRGKAMLEPEKLEAYRYTANFPAGKLHPSISSSTFSHFMKREYDTAVFAAFRAVEVAVRTAAQLPDTVLGVDLMRQAFKSGTGPLTDTTTMTSEQDAMQHFFAGAIGSFKNPTSHRANTVKSPQEAISMVQLADFLLRIVDERAPR